MDIFSFLSYVVVTSFTPGPNNIMAMTKGTRQGFKKAFPFCVGVSLGFLLVMLSCAAFSALLFNVIPQIQTFMSYIGAAYILYLAFVILRDKPHTEKRAHAEPDTLVSAMLFQFINPKGIIYGITLMSSYILPNYTSLPIIGLFVLFFSVVGLASTCLWAFAGTMIQKVFQQHKHVINIIMALLLVYCAVMLLLPH